MNIRRAEGEDLPAILSILCEAQGFLRRQGVDQWQDGYPNQTVVQTDVEQQTGYVAEQGGEILAYGVCSFAEESSYRRVYHGQWKTPEDMPYAVIHRLASGERFRRSGAAAQLLRFFETLARERGGRVMRIDTHRDNRPMRQFLQKHGFYFCGDIRLADGGWRMAFEKQW